MLTRFWAALRARLTDDWRRAYKWASVQLSAIGALIFATLAAVPELLPQVWASIPADVRDYLPAGVKALIPAMFAASVIIARVTKKKDKPDA